MFELKSDVIYKNNPVNKLNFDEYKIDKPIESSNNILYATASTIQTAFNTKITYDEKTNTISLYTLPYLNEYYKEAVKKYGYDGISEEFANGKTLTKDMLVVNKDNKYGVISTNNLETIIGNKYDKMIYLESTREFIVTSDGKCGILSTDGETKIGLRYEDVGLIDGKLGLYYTKNNNLYGVVNSKGKMLTYNEFEDIGVDRNTFSLGDMKSNYILYNNCIPLKKDGKWGMVDKLGTVILNFDYDSLGYIEEETDLYYNTTPTPVQTGTANEININNVATIPSIEGIVFGINGKYGVVNAIGNLIIPFKCDKIFSATNEGVDEYFLERSGMTVSLKKYLELNKINVEEIYQSIVKTENWKQ